MVALKLVMGKSAELLKPEVGVAELEAGPGEGLTTRSSAVHNTWSGKDNK